MTALHTRSLFQFASAVALASALSAHASAPPDTDLLLARDAAVKGNWKILDGYRQRFSGHLLEAYPEYWSLASRLERAERADPAELQAFLDRYPDSPLAEVLRRDWLKALGAGAQWNIFRKVHPGYAGDDAEVGCFSLQERLERKDPEALSEARAWFVSGREAPVACDSVFAAAMDASPTANAQAWERLRKVLANGHLRDAKRVAALLGPKSGLQERAIEQAYRDPARFLASSKVLPATTATQELLVFAVLRLARSKPEEAAERLVALGSRLSEPNAQYAWGHVAWHAAGAHHPRALDWYARTGDSPLTDTQLAWKARAALRASDWPTVFDAIKSMSPEESRESSWRYWRGRALKALGQIDAGNAMIKTVAQEPGFYGLLAADDLGLSAPPEWNGWRPAEADLERVRTLPGVARALALYRVDLDNEAFREWVAALRGLDDRSLLAAAELARLAQEHDRAINTADRTVQTHDFAQRYPTHHRDALSAAAKQWGMDEAWLYGIIRQESRFVAEARSRVGATGLMQLMPATARWVARQMALPAFRPAMLTQPELNVKMGTFYFRQVLNHLGDPVLATAAYNAGPGRAQRWRDVRPLEGAIYAETIPFNETRDYVKKVVANAWYYTHRLNGKTVSMRQLLGQVAPKPANAALAATLP